MGRLARPISSDTIVKFGDYISKPSDSKGVAHDLCILKTSANKTIERYKKNPKNLALDNIAPEEATQLQEEASLMAKKIEELEISKRKFLGNSVDSSSVDELQATEDQLEKSLSIIRARKTLLYKEKVQQLKEQEKALAKENAELRQKREAQQHLQVFNSGEEEEERRVLEVETELFIGLPERRSFYQQSVSKTW